MKRPIRSMASVAMAGLTVAACANDGESSSCSAPFREALDPQSGVHLLDSESLDYLSDPPTSGPHVSAPLPVGAIPEPLPFPVQVSVLEAGGVMVQYGEDATASEVAELESLAGDGAVVAPLIGDGPAVVATAWLHKQECSAVDRDVIDAFIVEHLDVTQGH